MGDSMIDLRIGQWETALADVSEVDAIITDCPYSAKTHAGHDAGTAGVQPTLTKTGKYNRACGHPDYGYDRRTIDYTHWTPADVQAFVAFWAPRTRGWMVSLTDDVLFPVWRDAMRDAGRTVFQDVPAVISGMTVRLCGDGPSSWAIHCAVSRPSTAAAAKWGTLPGGYYGPSERQLVTGGKPLWLMRALVRDYSRPGDTICDPCGGSFTTAIAACYEGRSAISCEMDPATFAKACARVDTKTRQISVFIPRAEVKIQDKLL